MSVAVFGDVRSAQHNMTGSYLACPPVLWLGLQKPQNEVLGVVANVLPVALMEDNAAAAAFVDEVLKVFGAEWRVAAEEGIRYNTH